MKQNEKLPSARWFGRIVGALMIVAKKNNHRLGSLRDVTVLDLYIRVQEVAAEGEKELINQLMAKYNEKKKEEEKDLEDSESQRQQRIGNQEAELLYRRGKFSDLIQEIDYNAQENQAARKKILMWIIPIAVIILSIVVYNLPYFKEMRFYNEVVRERELYKCMDYINMYPDGKHLEEVVFLKVDLTKKMGNIMEYLDAYPVGKYADKVNALCDSLWDNEIAKYAMRDKTGEAADAIKYMEEMLKYMKENRINNIKIDIESKINLKDYSTYDERARKLLEINTDSNLPLAQHMISLKDNFTNADQQTLREILLNGLQKSLDKIFTPGFIIAGTGGTKLNSPNVHFVYNIENQETDLGFCIIPEVWTYSENKVPKAYLLGISINFDATFLIPNSSVSYSYSERGNPESSISNIENIKDGYRKMTIMCFARFSNTMSDNLGLEEVYFKGEK